MRRLRTTVILLPFLGLSLGGSMAPPAVAAPVQSTAPGIAGTVTDTSGAPLEGVTVEAWIDENLLGGRITDEDGRFSFEWTEPFGAEQILLRANRMGYRMVERRIDPRGADELVLRLDQEPISIRGLVVESEGLACRIEDQEDARDLWRAMRSHYVGTMDTVGIATYLSEKEAVVEPGEIGPLDLPPEGAAQRGSSSQLRFSWGRRVRRSGYAFPVRRTERGSSFDSWSYAPLHADFAPHFVGSTFGDLHRFRIQDRGRFGWVLEFCPEEPERPSIVGSLRLAPDTTLREADWLFRTEDPQEAAGGHAIFPPATDSVGENHPLPRESIFWRRLPDGSFQEIHQRYEEWIVAQGDTVPFLAPR